MVLFLVAVSCIFASLVSFDPKILLGKSVHRSTHPEYLFKSYNVAMTALCCFMTQRQ